MNFAGTTLWFKSLKAVLHGNFLSDWRFSKQTQKNPKHKETIFAGGVCHFSWPSSSVCAAFADKYHTTKIVPVNLSNSTCKPVWIDAHLPVPLHLRHLLRLQDTFDITWQHANAVCVFGRKTLRRCDILKERILTPHPTLMTKALQGVEWRRVFPLSSKVIHSNNVSSTCQ